MSKPRVMIASPTPGNVKTVFMKTVIATLRDLWGRGIESDFETFDAADLPLQRNILATSTVRAGKYTHLFMTDADMMYAGDLCATMIGHNKRVIGIPYAAKSFDITKLAEFVAKGLTVQEAALFATPWVASLKEEAGQFSVKDGISRANGSGLGAILIQCSVLQDMIDKGAVRLQQTPMGQFYNFFSTRRDDADGDHHTSDDGAFGNRWRLNYGGEVWAMVDATVFHVGDFAYGGNYLHVLQALKKMQDQKELSTINP